MESINPDTVRHIERDDEWECFKNGDTFKKGCETRVEFTGIDID